MEDGSDISFQDKLIEFGKKNIIVLALFAGGLTFLGIGLIQIMGAKTASVKFEKSSAVAGASIESSTSIKVDVEGQVLRPGVYSLNADSRVQDALIAAGGLSSSANRNAINLAAKLIDGQKVYVPGVGEVANTGTTGITRSTSSGQASITGLVSVNSGSQSELESLPAIGPVTAQKIINTRPYGTLEELVSKKAVGKATFDKIKDQITL